MKLSRHRLPTLHAKKPYLFKASNRIDPCEFCLSQAYGRIVKLQRYRITARVNQHMVAVKLPEKWICTLKARKEIDNRNWACIEVQWEGKTPTLSQLETIKDDFLGKEAYFMVIFQTEIKPCSVKLVHSIGDYFLPGQS